METYDPYEELKSLRSDDSLKKLRRDHGKAEEIVSQLIIAMEQLGGTSNDLFSLISGPSITPQIKHIAELIMGKLRLKSIDPLEVLTNTGMSDAVRLYAVTNGGIEEKDLPVHLIIDNRFPFPRTSLAVVERITSQQKLKEIALKGSRSTGALAAKKLKSSDDLYDVAMSARYNTAALIAVGRLPNDYLVLLVKSYPNEAVLEAAIGRITDKKQLQEFRTNWPRSGSGIGALLALDERLKELETTS